MPTLHVHLDESGDWTFNPKGSRYFVLTVAWTYDPQPLASALTALRFGFVAQGNNIESFHASPDKQSVRNAVVQTLLAHPTWQFASVVLEKCKINPSLYSPERFYPQFAGTLLKFLFPRRRISLNHDKGAGLRRHYPDGYKSQTRRGLEGYQDNMCARTSEAHHPPR